MPVSRMGRRRILRLTPWLFAWMLFVLLAVPVLPVSAAPLRYPAYIRVGRTFSSQCAGKPRIQRVDVVPFKDYVKNVLPHEWIASWSDASLDAGAVAVAQYAYQTAVIEQKWSRRGYAFDVVDSMCDQVYIDGLSHPRTNAAVDRMWGLTMVRNGATFTPYYRATDALCSGVGDCMGQWGSQNLAVQGLNAAQILTRYYGNIMLVPR